MNDEIILRAIRAGDDAAIAAIIRQVMPEFGASGAGFAIQDAEVDTMSSAYGGPQSGYYVLERDARLLGGGGFASLEGGPADTCELRKMYFMPEVRGLGWGARLLDRVLVDARAVGFSQCYLETLASMQDARKLYQKRGFVQLSAPLGATGHFGCNAWYLLAL